MRYGVTLLLVLGILAYVDLGAVWQTLSAVDPLPLAIAFALALGDRFLMILKWQPLLNALVPGVPLGKTSRVYFASSFAGEFLPATIGADLLRAVAVGRERAAIPEVGASIAVERLLGLAAAAVLTLLSLLAALAAPVDLTFVVPWALTALVTSSGILVAVVNESATSSLMRLMDRIPRRFGLGAMQRLAAGLASYRGQSRTLLIVGVLTLLEQALPILIIWAVSWGMPGGEVTLGMLIVAVPLTMFMARLPVAVNGLGLLEGSLIYLLGLFGVAPEAALSIAIGWRAAVIVAALPGIVFLQELAGHRRAVPEA